MRPILIASLFFFGITMAAPVKETLAERGPKDVTDDLPYIKASLNADIAGTIVDTSDSLDNYHAHQPSAFIPLARQSAVQTQQTAFGRAERRVLRPVTPAGPPTKQWGLSHQGVVSAAAQSDDYAGQGAAQACNGAGQAPEQPQSDFHILL
ncbi:hypothetical protein PENFLA_c044G03876 [Penicillium flavigenum]|uniref:Uncharacterized protein n=1 Tax=Penicillium flavigenum TaxID=254877 RepID=A0A1V6SI53_9EURO|nr:hypothetical protein PENFLA_c044G03876 [Penicillium flavigenum]